MWSWRADAGAKFARDESLAPATVANKLVHRGEREVSRKPLRREGRVVSAYTCGLRALARTFSREGPRVPAGTRSSLRPLIEEG